MDSKQRVIFIVPCYNEANRLKIDSFLHFFQNYPLISFCFVDDGSKDDTASLLKHLSEQNAGQVRYLQLVKNQGKAEAVRQGILSVSNEFAYIGYLDADLATPLSEIPNFIKIIEQFPDLVLVAGSRISRMGAQIKRYWFRHYFGRIFATIVSQMLKLPFYDTQCGAKLLKANVASQVFKEAFISPWLFDVEVIFRILKTHTHAAQSIYELPLHQWEEQGESKIKLKDLLKVPIELLKIWKKYQW